jgi:hypothetical protein
MAETLGTLCDKLTIVTLKKYHTKNKSRLGNLKIQEKQLIYEINEYISKAINGCISIDKLVFASNKVYKKAGNEIEEVTGNIGEVFSALSKVNCDLWHEQEKVYEFEKVKDKDNVVRNLALLNLKRNNCIDKIDNLLQKIILDNKGG